MTVYEEIQNERTYQQGRWGNQADDTLNTPWHWTAYITQYAGKWMAGTWIPHGKDVTNSFRAMMIKVAALAVAAVESLDRQRKDNGRTFYE